LFHIWRVYGYSVYRFGWDLHRDLSLALYLLRKPVGGSDMTGFYIVGGVLALGILIYLLIALLKPEVFS
jgi:K+-transporting ATPase KdpF subunit